MNEQERGRFKIEAEKNGSAFCEIEFSPQFDLRSRSLSQFVAELQAMGLTIRRIYRSQMCPGCDGSGILWMPMENEEWTP